MDPLQELYELYDQMRLQPKPDLTADPVAMMGNQMFNDPTIQQGEVNHPITAQRDQIDIQRLQGVPIEIAHQNVKGPTDLSNTQMKADLASTFGRAQQQGEANTINPDKNSPNPSLFAADQEAMNTDPVSALDMKTRMSQEIPNNLQVDTQEETDYTEFDLMYLQTYGRA